MGDANSCCYLYSFVIFSPFCTYIFLPSLFTPHFLNIADWQSKSQCFLKTFNQRTFSIFQLCPLITHRFSIIFFNCSVKSEICERSYPERSQQ